MKNTFVDALIGWPARVAQHLTWVAPFIARIVVGEEFAVSGWGKLVNLPQTIENFVGWNIPIPHFLAPLTAGIEFFGGIFLLLGLLTRISGGALGVVMIVAIMSAKWDQVTDSEGLLGKITTLVGFDESEYFALFLWLAIAGAGALSLDHLLMRYTRSGTKAE
jgi:putative oxidoreductase